MRDPRDKEPQLNDEELRFLREFKIERERTQWAREQLSKIWIWLRWLVGLVIGIPVVWNALQGIASIWNHK